MASSSQAPNHQKNGKGRQKVRMEKMENKSNLQVTFSKRRYGLFKKASELCTLTGCEMGIIVFSPGKKVFSFGHPSVHKVFEDCFANEEGEGTRARNNIALMPPPLQMRWDERLMEAHRAASVAEQNMQLSEVEMRMETEKKKTVVLEEREKEEMVGHPSIKEMMDPELVELSAFLNTLKQSIMITMSNINRGVLTPPALNRVPMEMALNPMGGMGEEGFGPQL